MEGRVDWHRQGQSGPIYSIGSSTRQFSEFLARPHRYRVCTLVDLRMYPYSRRFPHFSRESLEDMISAAGLRYLFLGKELGGYRRGGYEAYMRTAEFAKGLHALASFGREGRAAFMCCEHFPWKCHRRFVAAGLECLGWQVIQIIDKGRTWQPQRSLELRVKS